MRIPFLATLLACSLWWTSAAALQAQEEVQRQPDQPAANQQEKAEQQEARDLETEELIQEERPQVREVEEAEAAKEEKAAAPGAQEERRREAQRTQRAQERAKDQARIGRETRGLAIRAEAIKDMEVRNYDGEELGQIEDLMVDAETGKIRYAAISVGGFLGIGDKLIAVPWERFELRETGEAGDLEYVLFVDLDQEQLAGMRGIEEETWPAYAEEQFEGEEEPRVVEEPDEEALR